VLDLLGEISLESRKQLEDAVAANKEAEDKEAAAKEAAGGKA
jgi:hypothetical protein